MDKKEKIHKEKRRIMFTIIALLLIVAMVIIIFFIICGLSQVNKEDNNSVETIYQNQEKEDISNKKGKTTDWELILVNKYNKIPEHYKVELKKVDKYYEIDKRIAENLENMLSDARKEGMNPIICSAYRNNNKQGELYNKKVKEYIMQGFNQKDSEDKASKWIAIPGTGEHETGLAVDIVSEEYQILDEEQEKTKEQKWLIENSYKYGFILRYPTEKKEITNINYEPWHYRYVGIENATYMKEEDICLEEYIDYLKSLEKDIKEKV